MAPLEHSMDMATGGDCCSRLTRQSKPTFGPASLCHAVSAKQELLLRLRDDGLLPMISDQPSRKLRTNAESIVTVRYPGLRTKLSSSIAIGSGFHIDEHTHIEAVCYPVSPDMMRSLSWY